MANFITDDICEEVTICDPNEIIQDCLPEGEDLECLYTLDFDVPWWFRGYEEGPVLSESLMAFGHGPNAIDVGNDIFGNPIYGDVDYDVKKVIKVDEDTGIQQERWLAEANGGNGDDYLSGVGLLKYLDWNAGGTGAVAQVSPSVYLGDLIHFELDGGAGNDTIEGANNSDVLRGGVGNDDIYGFGGDDNIDGGSGDDYVEAGNGNDIVDGGTGADFISGGNGNDELYGGDGIYDDILYGDAGNDNLTGGDGDDELWGGTGDDWSAGGFGDDTIISGNGDDCADGGAGDDFIDMGAGDDRALGGDGDDTMYGGSGDDRLDGGNGDDFVDGGSGDDLVDGGDGDDMVYGGDGDDIVRGGLGDDSVWGGEGCDVFAFCEVSFGCKDVIEDFSAGRDPDRIDLSELDIDSIRVENTGFNEMVRLDLIVDGEAVQQILVSNEIGANLKDVFSADTAYGGDDGSLVKIGGGVMVDLPTTSVMVADDGGMFF